jgi:pimeloyl-ACP methyl ester carboxylesterase
MDYEEITWQCDGCDFSLGLDRLGTAGRTILLLPALSSISTRREMRPLQECLAAWFATIAVDWPGFGDKAKPDVDWRPEIYEAYLAYLFAEVAPNVFGVIAAGHGAGYVLKHFAGRQYDAARLVLLSPTWRGPLPTMMGKYHALFPKIARAFDPPFLGPMLYGLNVNRLVVGMMARGHVYANPQWLNGHRMKEKLGVTRAPGARRGSARFVTGCLDPFRSREEQIKAAQRVTVPMLNFFATTAPGKSRSEMEALGTLSSVTTARLSQGKLSFYEEFPEEAAEVIAAFLTTTELDRFAG